MADDTQDLVRFLQDRNKTTLQSGQPSNGDAPPAPIGTGLSDQAAQLTQMTRQALSNLPGALQNATPRAVTAQGDLSWFARNSRKDEQGREIPIDTESGINLGEFSRMVWQRRPEERL